MSGSNTQIVNLTAEYDKSIFTEEFEQKCEEVFHKILDDVENVRVKEEYTIFAIDSMTTRAHNSLVRSCSAKLESLGLRNYNIFCSFCSLLHRLIFSIRVSE